MESKRAELCEVIEAEIHKIQRPKLRQIMELYLEGKTCREIGKAVKMCPGNVRGEISGFSYWTLRPKLKKHINENF